MPTTATLSGQRWRAWRQGHRYYYSVYLTKSTNTDAAAYLTQALLAVKEEVMTDAQRELSSLPVLGDTRELVELQPAEAALSKEELLQKWKKSAERCDSVCVSAYCCIICVFILRHMYLHTAVCFMCVLMFIRVLL